MEKRTLGRSGIEVAPLTFGGNVFGWTLDEKRSFEILDAFVVAGFNFIDTADSYSRWVPGHAGGESETIIGRWMRERNNRAEVIIATKVGADMGQGKRDLSRKHILLSVENSLKRLQTDYIDLYQSHYDDTDTPIEETLETYSQLVKDGKVRVIGASNFSAERLIASIELSTQQNLPVYQTLQPLYNLYDREEKEKFLNIVIAGGGPTGVEIAGMLAEMGHNIRVKEYPEITDLQGHIHLVDAGPVLLGPMSRKAQVEATRVLLKLGVHIKLNTAVKDYVDGQVFLSTGEVIESTVLIWASGVIGREVPGLPAEIIGRGRRIQVDEFNKVKGTANIFALGDISLQTTDKNFPNGHPQLAQVAIQQGTVLGANFKRMISNEPLKQFSYVDKGSMAIISKYKAVADLPKLFFKGFFAWLVWLFIHIIPIAGFRNKVNLAFSWLWSFMTNDPTLRLIIRPNKEEFK